MVVKILPNEKGSPNGKLADAEVHFTDGAMEGLKLLGFELNGGKFGCYAPPFSSDKWLTRFEFMEKAGARWWPIAGGVYVVRAVKRTVGMRLVTPAWKKERAAAPALSPVTQSNGHAHRRDDD